MADTSLLNLLNVRNCQLKDVKREIRNGADPNTTNRYGETVLHLFHQDDRLRFVMELILNKANPNLKDKEGYTALHKASEKGQFQVVKHLITKGAADPNCKTKIGETALHIASKEGKFEVVKHLIDNGAKPELQDNNGKTAYDHAMDGKVKSERVDENFKKVMNHLQPLTPNRADPSVENEKYETALHITSEKSKVEVMKYPITNGRSENLEVPALFVGPNLLPTVEMGLSNLTKSGVAMAPQATTLLNGADPNPKLRNKESKTPNLKNRNGFQEFMKKYGPMILVILIFILIACTLIVYFIQNSKKGMKQRVHSNSCSRCYSILHTVANNSYHF